MANVNTDIAYTFIRNKILTSEYALGSPLKPHRLAADIGVSRTPIRDALRLLETDGLVVMRPRLGARVVSLSIEQFSHLCAMRLALESYAAGLAAGNRTEEQLEQLRAAFAALSAAGAKLGTDPRDLELIGEYQQHDLQFHIVLLDAAQNPLMKAECARIHLLDHLLSGKFMHSATPLDGRQDAAANVREHEALLRAVERRDVTGARQAMERHLQPVVDRSIEALKHEASYKRAALRKIQMIDNTVRA